MRLHNPTYAHIHPHTRGSAPTLHTHAHARTHTQTRMHTYTHARTQAASQKAHTHSHTSKTCMKLNEMYEFPLDFPQKTASLYTTYILAARYPIRLKTQDRFLRVLSL